MAVAERAAVPAAFAPLLATVLGILCCFLMAGWPKPIHKVTYTFAPDGPPSGPPRRYLRVSVLPDDRIELQGREVGFVALHNGARAYAGEEPSGFEVDPHPEARWELVMEIIPLLYRSGAGHVRLRHDRSYDEDVPPAMPGGADSRRSSSRYE
jgi:hypothetical protein